MISTYLSRRYVRNLLLINGYQYSIKRSNQNEYLTNIEIIDNNFINGLDFCFNYIKKDYIFFLNLLISWFDISSNNNNSVTDKLINNSILYQLKQNKLLQNLSNDFIGDIEYINIIYRDIIHDSNMIELSHKTLDDQKFLHNFIDIVSKYETLFDVLYKHDVNFITNSMVWKRLIFDVDNDIVNENLTENINENDKYRSFYISCASNIGSHYDDVVEIIKPNLENWNIERISFVDCQILVNALVEWFYLKETPKNVLINEYVELAKKFSTKESGRFINGILNAIMNIE